MTHVDHNPNTNKCFLPELSGLEELQSGPKGLTNKVKQFHKALEDIKKTLLGQTYLLPEMLLQLEKFDHESMQLQADIPLSSDQQKQYDIHNKFDIYDKYFGVYRVAHMTHGQFVQQYLNTSAKLIHEMRFTSMSRGEIAYIIKAWEAANLVLLSPHNDSRETIATQALPTTDIPIHHAERALYRWKLAHHGFALFISLSGYCFDRAVHLLKEHGDEQTISDWIDKGAHLFRATTACMEFGSSFTATIYQKNVRSDMSRANENANLPNGFSGTQNFDYIQWRKKKIQLLRAVKENITNLSPQLMYTLELFRTFYLEDMHIHTIIAGRMVGMEKSLLQHKVAGRSHRQKITAGDMLRMMATKREQEVQFIVENS